MHFNVVVSVYGDSDQVADALDDAACAGLYIRVRTLQQGHQGSDAVALEEPAHVCALEAQVEDDICTFGRHCSAGAGEVPHYGGHITLCNLLPVGWLSGKYPQHLGK